MEMIQQLSISLKALRTRLEKPYRALFSIEEIERESILQWMFGASLLFFYAIFSDWISASYVTVETAKRGAAVCWPYFQNCGDYFFLHALPNGYSQSTFYMAIFGVMMIIIWAMWRRYWSLAHALLSILLVWEMLVTLVFSYEAAGPYNYYHIVLTMILLFVPYKEFFLKLAFVFMYFLSVTVKIDSTWILGSYFTSLKNGLPLFPDFLTPVFTNLVMFMQMVGCWFLLSKRMWLQRFSLIYFLTFHWYSGIFVYFTYPTMSLPALVILFGPMYRHTPIPFSRRAFGGVVILLLLSGFQILGFVAPGDRRMTFEGDKFGMFMFEANHQCVVTITTVGKNQTPVQNSEVPNGTACNNAYCLVKTTNTLVGSEPAIEYRYESGSSWNRCYPYVWWSKLHTRCALNPNITKVALRIDHSINGGAFYRIVDEADVCTLPYYTLGPNAWITQPPEARLVGYPLENSYHY